MIDDLRTLATHSKYLEWVVQILRNAKLQNRSKKDGEYYERHHILPKSVFPDYADLNTHPENGILLSGREHFLVHWMMAKVNFHDSQINKAMIVAFGGMSLTGLGRRNLSSKQFEIAKKYAAKASSLAQSGVSYVEKFGEEEAIRIKSRLSEIHSGRTFSEDHKKKIGAAHRNKVVSDTTRRKISESREGIEGPTKGKIAVNNGLKHIFIDEGDEIPEGFVVGAMAAGPMSEQTKKAIVKTRRANGSYRTGIDSNFSKPAFKEAVSKRMTENNPNSHPISTPYGEFKSINQAVRNLDGITSRWQLEELMKSDPKNYFRIKK